MIDPSVIALTLLVLFAHPQIVGDDCAEGKNDEPQYYRCRSREPAGEEHVKEVSHPHTLRGPAKAGHLERKAILLVAPHFPVKEFCEPLRHPLDQLLPLLNGQEHAIHYLG